MFFFLEEKLTCNVMKVWKLNTCAYEMAIIFYTRSDTKISHMEKERKENSAIFRLRRVFFAFSFTFGGKSWTQKKNEILNCCESCQVTKFMHARVFGMQRELELVSSAEIGTGGFDKMRWRCLRLSVNFINVFSWKSRKSLDFLVVYSDAILSNHLGINYLDPSGITNDSESPSSPHSIR